MTKALIRYASRTLHANSKLFAMKMLDSTTTDTQISTYLNSNRILGESISQALNPDGVAGTSHEIRVKQIVADLLQAVSQNKNATASIVNDAITKFAGLEHKKDSWHFCTESLGQ